MPHAVVAAPPPVTAPAPAGRTALLGAMALLAVAALAESQPESVAGADEAWARRAEGSQDRQAAAGPIGEAVAGYERALESSPDSIAIREKLLRALYYQAQFATADGPARRAIHARGRELADEGISRLADELGRSAPFDLRSPRETAAALAGRPESAALFFWAAGHLGLWAEMSGAFAAARQGVAGRIRDYSATVVLLDERYENAGGHRILGRLHTEVPRIPLITGWVSRDIAVASLERAVTLAPEYPWNRFYLADALLEFRPGRRHEAVAMLEALIIELPRPDFEIEDRKTLADARQTLARAR